MSETPHSPIPWKVVMEIAGQSVEDIVDAKGEHVVCFGHDYDEYGSVGKADADFICTAVNAHQALVDACLEAVGCYCIDDIPYDKMRAALKLAGVSPAEKKSG